MDRLRARERSVIVGVGLTAVPLRRQDESRRQSNHHRSPAVRRIRDDAVRDSPTIRTERETPARSRTPCCSRRPAPSRAGCARTIEDSVRTAGRRYQGEGRVRSASRRRWACRPRGGGPGAPAATTPVSRRPRGPSSGGTGAFSPRCSPRRPPRPTGSRSRRSPPPARR